MPTFLLILLWTLLTLGIAAVSILLGRRYTVAYPIAMMAVLMTVAQVLASKIVAIGPFMVAGGILVYSATFLITDLISELWGKREARIAVWAGFYGSVFLAVMVWIVTLWPAPAGMQGVADTFAAALSLTPRIVIASLTTYLVAQHLDVWLFHFFKRLTHNRHLWLRNNASTLISQGVDSVLFTTIAFAGLIPLLPLIVGMYVVKVAIALIDTPFMYGMRAFARRITPVRDTP